MAKPRNDRRALSQQLGIIMSCFGTCWLDDGEKVSVVALLGVKDLVSTAALVPLIRVEDKNIPATSMTLADNGSRLAMSFPSLKAIGFKINPHLKNSPTLRVINGQKDLFASTPVGYQLTKVEQAKSLVNVTASSKTVRSAPDGTGQGAVSFSAKDGDLSQSG